MDVCDCWLTMSFSTSGTTGNPKMVQHNQISYPLAHTITGKHFHRLKPGDVNWVLTEQGTSNHLLITLYANISPGWAKA